MQVALEVWSSSYAEVEATCRRAETLGIDGFYYGESPHDLNLDCWTTLAGLARATDRIRLGPVIANVLPTYRSAALLAKQATTVAELSGGRVDLRTGVGAAAPFARPWWEPFGIEYPDYDVRLADLERALDELVGLSAAGDPVPVTIAATGHRALGLAAERADTWETSFCTPAEFATRAAAFEGRTAGREVKRSLEVDAFVAGSATRVERLLERVRADRGRAEDLEPVFERALVGEAGSVADQIAALAAAGVDQLVVALHDPHDVDAIETIAAAAGLVRDG